VEGVPPVEDRQPDCSGERKSNQIVLDEACQHHHQRGHAHRARGPRLPQQDDQSSNINRVSEKLRVVHPDIVGEDKQPCDERKDGENGVRWTNLHHPERRENARADCRQRQQRYDPAGHDIIAGKSPESADEIERERRIVVEEEAVRAGVEAACRHRRLCVIGIPAFVGIERNLKTQTRKNARKSDSAAEREQPASDRYEADAGDHGLAQSAVGWMS